MLSRTKTVKYDVDGTIDQFAPAKDTARVVRVFSDRMVHIRADVSQPATTETAAPIAAFCAETIQVPAGHKIHFILADHEVSGSIWLTE